LNNDKENLFLIAQVMAVCFWFLQYADQLLISTQKMFNLKEEDYAG
jgi:hypothetical protein